MGLTIDAHSNKRRGQAEVKGSGPVGQGHSPEHFSLSQAVELHLFLHAVARVHHDVRLLMGEACQAGGHLLVIGLCETTQGRQTDVRAQQYTGYNRHTHQYVVR